MYAGGGTVGFERQIGALGHGDLEVESVEGRAGAVRKVRVDVRNRRVRRVLAAKELDDHAVLGPRCQWEGRARGVSRAEASAAEQQQQSSSSWARRG